MKCFAVAFIICVLSVSASEASLTDEQKIKLLNDHKECVKSTSVDPKLVQMILAGKFADEPTFKEYLLCVSKRIGFVDASGALQKFVIAKKVGAAIDDANLALKVTEECITPKANIADTIFESTKCFYSKLPKFGTSLF